MTTEPETMSVKDFYERGYKRAKTGFSAWLRALPCDTPARVPDEYVHGRAASQFRAGFQAVFHETGAVCRSIDGAAWVLKPSKKD